MAHKDGLDKRIQQVAEIGFENARLLPQVKNWCQHIKVQSSKAGMVAEIYNVPTRNTITCDHAEPGRIESMYLRNVATSFIVKNCRNCPHHAPINNDNIGRIIIEEYDEAQAKKAKEENTQKATKARLRGLISGDLDEALQSEHVTIQSILKLIALLDDESIHLEAAQKLIQASQIAPELFSDLAIEVICSHFVDPKHGKQCIEVICKLCDQRNSVSPVAFEAAKRCLNESQIADIGDDACFIIGQAITDEPILIDEVLIESVVSVSKYLGVGIALERDFQEYPGRNFALTQIAQHTPTLLKIVLRLTLTSEYKDDRIRAAGIAEFLVSISPEIPLDLTYTIIKSLELDDDIYDAGPADTALCDVLAALYVRFPNQMQAKIDLTYPNLSKEVQTILLSIYQRISQKARGKGLRRNQPNPIYVSCLPRIVPRMVQIVGGMGYNYDAKRSAVDGLSQIASNFPDVLLPHLDLLLGMLANLSHELVLISENNQTDDYFSFLEKQSNKSGQGYLVREITEVIQSLATFQPSDVLMILDTIEPTLSSNVSHEARYKSQLVDIYGTLAHQHKLTPVIIPKLYRFLMDFDSVAVRGAAVQVIGKLLAKIPKSIPQTMIEMIIHYVNDTFEYIHKSASRAVQNVPLNTPHKALFVAVRLAHLFEVYDDDPYFRKELLRSLLIVTRPFPKLLEAITVPLLSKQSRSDNYLLVTDALDKFHRILHLLPSPHSEHFVKLVIDFFIQHQQRGDSLDATRDMLKLLFNLPRQAILANASHIQEGAISLSEDSPWLAFQLTGLLLYHEQYAFVVKIASEIAAKQPKTKRYQWVVRQAMLMCAVAQTEIEAMNGNLIVSIKSADDAIVLKHEDDEEQKETIDFADIFAIEKRIAQRARLL